MSASDRLCASLGAAAAVAMVLYLGSAAAAPGDLDPSFGTAGVAEAAIGSYATAEGLALQPDGKIVVAGWWNEGLALARFNSDGSLDSGFGSSGTVSGPSGMAYAVAVQPDGRILAAGLSSGAMVVLRYTASGGLDPTFGVGGIATGPPGAARGIVVQPDGNIVVGGSSPDPESPALDNILLLRLRPDGTPDAGFGSNGVVRTQIGRSSDAWALALQADGKILAAGSGGDFSNSMTVVRYQRDGQLDPTFATNGVVMTPASFATAIGVQPDGRIVMAGSTSPGLALMRLEPNGSLDPSFGSDGLVTVRNGGLIGAGDLALQSDGRIVIAGWDMNFFTIVRFATSGELDPSFGEGGISRRSFGFGSDARAVAIQPDGRILAAGSNSHESATHFAVARYRVSSPTTIDAAPVIVPYGAKVTLQGTAAEPRRGGAVHVVGRDCVTLSTTGSGATTEDSAGAWTAKVRPRARTRYRAEIAGDRSVAVDVQVRPRVTLRRLNRSRVQIRVVYGHSLAGETVELQRLRKESSWVHIRFGSLRRLGRARDGVVSGVTVKTGQRGGSIRVFLEQPNESACFADAISRPIHR